jgi:colanic acid biosynthesis glycosyl transferase WcaI
MRILLLTAYFPPDTGSAAHLFYELGAELVRRGHQVTVITGMPGYHALGPLERYKGKRWIREQVEGMEVVRVATPQLPRHLMVGRALWQFGGAAAFFLAGLRLSSPHESLMAGIHRPSRPPHPNHQGNPFHLCNLCNLWFDVAMVYSPPLPLGLAAWGLKRLRGIPFVLNVQDLFPQSIIDLGLLKNRWLIRLFEGMERFVYARADAITVHSEGNRQHVARKMERGEGEKGEGEKVKVIPNWVDTDFIRPGERMNGFREEQGLGDAFVVSFAGVLGYSQDLDVVLEAARILNGGRWKMEDGSWKAEGGDWQSAIRNPNSEILFLIVGDGVEKARLEAKARQMEPCNVRFLPMQPREKYPAVLHASDIGLVTLHAEVRTPVVPSKILSIMAAGRPVVAAMNLDGDGPRLIAEARCGLCVPPEDPEALAQAVLKLYHDPSLRQELGRNGRRYAEEHLSLERCVARYEALLQQV